MMEQILMASMEKIKQEQAEKEKIKLEQEKAKENFGDLINLVSKRYEKSETMTPEMVKDFIKHNENILDWVVELGIKKELTDQELKLAEISAVLHDLTKGDAPPEKAKNITNYVLASHGEKAAEQVDNLVTNKILEKAGVDITDENAVKSAKDQIASVIKEHMGPHPGFMDFILGSVNKQIQEENKKLKAQGKELIPEIKHPPAKGKISETLLAADMASLASRAGREKVLAIRSGEKYFNDQDKKTVIKYKNLRINLTMGEAALLSGFDSAADSHNMLKSETDRKWVQHLIDESKKEPYSYKNPKTNEIETITWHDATEKRVEYLTKRIPVAEISIDNLENRGMKVSNMAETELALQKIQLERAIKELEGFKQGL